MSNTFIKILSLAFYMLVLVILVLAYKNVL
jgi:hypothetical protein